MATDAAPPEFKDAGGFGAADYVAMEFYYQDFDGEQRGPVTFRGLRAGVAEGKVDDSSYIYPKLCDEWVQLGSLPTLLKLLQSLAADESPAFTEEDAASPSFTEQTTGASSPRTPFQRLSTYEEGDGVDSPRTPFPRLSTYAEGDGVDSSDESVEGPSRRDRFAMMQSALVAAKAEVASLRKEVDVLREEKAALESAASLTRRLKVEKKLLSARLSAVESTLRHERDELNPTKDALYREAEDFKGRVSECELEIDRLRRAGADRGDGQEHHHITKSEALRELMRVRPARGFRTSAKELVTAIIARRASSPGSSLARPIKPPPPRRAISQLEPSHAYADIVSRARPPPRARDAPVQSFADIACSPRAAVARRPAPEPRGTTPRSTATRTPPPMPFGWPFARAGSSRTFSSASSAPAATPPVPPLPQVPAAGAPRPDEAPNGGLRRAPSSTARRNAFAAAP